MTGVVSLITDLALALTDVCSVTLHNNYCGAFKQETRRYVLIYNLTSGQTLSSALTLFYRENIEEKTRSCLVIK